MKNQSQNRPLPEPVPVRMDAGRGSNAASF